MICTNKIKFILISNIIIYFFMNENVTFELLCSIIGIIKEHVWEIFSVLFSGLGVAIFFKKRNSKNSESNVTSIGSNNVVSENGVSITGGHDVNIYNNINETRNEKSVAETLSLMLEQHNNILNSLSSKISNGSGGMLYVTIKGIEYINHLNDRIEPPHVYYLNESEKIKVSPYINNLMQIFKYIDETEVLKSDDVDDEFEKRHRYCSMVTSSLSNNELILIEYYLSIYTGIELNRLCDIYALLENRKYPDGRKLNGPRYNIDVAKGYFKTDRERKIKEGKRK